jgi:hypothetical protein
MKILFLDIDGVVNCATTTQRHRGFIGIDPMMAFLVGKITLAVPDLKVVLSSSWRHMTEGREEVERQVVPIFDITPRREKGNLLRGDEIKAWLDSHELMKCDTPTSCPPFSRAMCMGHSIEKYAILDDDSDMLEEQLPNFFKTSWQTGITDEIAERVINHFQK